MTRAALGILIFISLSGKLANSQDFLKKQLIDSKTNTSVPYAYISLSGKKIIVNSDNDGFFIIMGTDLDTISISHIAYETLKIPIKEARKLDEIRLSELPVKINSVTISAKNAENTVKKSIENTYSILSKSMWFRCLRNDQVLYRDTLIIKARAEIFMELETLFSPSHGGIINCYLNNLKTENHLIKNNNSIPQFSIPAIYTPINRYIAGVSKKDDKVFYFSYQEANDSIVIISFKPKSSYVPNSDFVFKQGRFIINKHTGKFIRIDSNLNPEMMKYQRECMAKKKKPTLFYYEYSLSQFFDKDGLPERIHWQFEFSLKENNPNEIWTNNSDQILIRIENKPQITSEKLKSDSSLVNMKSHYSSNFENEFDALMH
jgi:hypothetical protein